MTEILIVDESAVICGGFSSLVESIPGVRCMTLIGSLKDLEGSALVSGIGVLIVTLDFYGLQQKKIVSHLCRINKTLRIVLAFKGAMFPSLMEKFHKPIYGAVKINSTADEITNVLKGVINGQQYSLPATEASKLKPFAYPRGRTVRYLSVRETEVLNMIAEGFNLTQIASEFGLSPKTISTHKMRAMKKLGLQSNVELVRFTMEQRAM